VGSIAAVLGALATLSAEHGIQDTPPVSWIFPSPSALNPSKLAWSEESDRGHVLGRNICESGTNKISSANGSGGRRCEMSPEEFAKFYPPLLETTLAASAHVAQTVAFRGFSHLPLYFTEKTLASTKVVLADPLPMACSDPIAFYCPMRMAWNASAIDTPLEAMAYDAETAFASSTTTFNVEKMVAEKLGL
jgi:hypothetical protein